MTAPNPSLDLRLGFGSRVRLSPYFDATLAAGVTHVTTYNHMVMPVSFGDPSAEYRRLVEGVVVWDVAGQRQIEVAGPDGARLAQLLSARDLTGLAVGQGRYAPMCDHQGRLINDPLLLRAAEDAFWFSIADNDILLWARAVGYERGLDVAVNELDVAPLAIQGPKAEDTMAALLGETVRAIRFFRYEPAEIDGIRFLLGRAGWSKQGGFELYLLDPGRGADLWNMVMEAGRPFGIGPGAPNYVERIESGLFSYRSDAPDDADPFEVGLGRWVSLDSDVEFIGKAALARRFAGGLTRELVGVVMEGPPVPPPARPWAVTLDGAPAGTVRTAAFSPRRDRNLGLAFLDVPANAPDTTVAIDVEGETRIATVVPLPFFG